MLPLKAFSFYEPKKLSDLFALLSDDNSHTKIMAGGTDVLPNLKHGLYDVNRVISLKRITQLQNYFVSEKKLTMGALVKLSDVARNRDVSQNFKALVTAASQIASPQIRNMGTVGGNVCLDTRCLYFNQTEFWRSALGYCLKKDGHCCHVVKTGKRCVAAASNDLATALLACDAKVTIASPQEVTEMSLDDFYVNNGEKNNALTTKQIVTSISVNKDSKMKSGFFKLRHRRSIDFPLISVAVCFGLSENQRFESGKIALNAIVAKPKVMDLAHFKGVAYNRELIAEIARLLESKCHPQTNICDDPAWRKTMVSHSVTAAFNDALVVTD